MKFSDILTSPALTPEEKSVWIEYRNRDQEKRRRLALDRELDKLRWWQKLREIKGQLEAEAATAAWNRCPIKPSSSAA